MASFMMTIVISCGVKLSSKSTTVASTSIMPQNYMNGVHGGLDHNAHKPALIVPAFSGPVTSLHDGSAAFYPALFHSRQMCMTSMLHPTLQTRNLLLQCALKALQVVTLVCLKLSPYSLMLHDCLLDSASCPLLPVMQVPQLYLGTPAIVGGVKVVTIILHETCQPICCLLAKLLHDKMQSHICACTHSCTCPHMAIDDPPAKRTSINTDGTSV